MAPIPCYHLALFDWNGTLLDDMPIWHKAMCATFQAFGVEPPTIDQYFRELEGDYLGVYHSRGITASREALNTIYHKAYAAHMHEAELNPFAMMTLLNLIGQGARVGLISTQLKSLVQPLLGSLPHADFPVGRLLCIARCHVRNKASAIQRVCRQLKISRDRVMYVGDAPSDIRHAKRAGVTSIAFLNGYVPEDLVRAAQPDCTVTKLIEIRECFSANKGVI